MPRLVVALAMFALALELAAASAFAQGVAPGGGVYNSTGIGSGLGGVTGGTGPLYPNGTAQPTLPPAPAPGGGLAAPAPSAPAASIVGPSHYPSSSYSFESRPRQPAVVPLGLPLNPAADVSFLKGCWRTDIYRHAGHDGLATWCFDNRGVGKVLLTRQDQPSFYCHAPAQAAFAAGRLQLTSERTVCTDGGSVPVGELDCQQAGPGPVQCNGAAPGAEAERWTVGLYRVR